MRPLDNRPVSRPRKGFSLVEAAIVLGVVGLVIGGIWVAASAVRSEHQITRTVSGFQDIIANMQGTFNRELSRTMGNGVITGQLIKMGIIPLDWIDKYGNAKTPIGTNFWINNVVNSDGTDPRFDIYIYPNVSKSQCLRILKAMPQNISSSWTDGIAKGGLVMLATTSWNTTTFPSNIPDSACSNTGDALTITFGYTENN